MVRRRGAALGGEAAELAALAGEQEVALRMLISEQVSGAAADVGGQTVDLCPLLTTQASTSVSVSTPAHPVVIERDRAIELAAIVDNALSNVGLHAGPAAKAYVLLEDLPDEVIVSVRDDGVGIPEGRLAQAEAEGPHGSIEVHPRSSAGARRHCSPANRAGGGHRMGDQRSEGEK